MATDQHRRDEHFERQLGTLLRGGVFVAAGVVLLGGILYLVQHGAVQPNHHLFHGEPANLRSPSRIIDGALRLDSRGLIMLGLLLLIATPVARVVFSVVGFLRQRDFLYVVLTLIVLAVLLYSLFIGELLCASNEAGHRACGTLPLIATCRLPCRHYLETKMKAILSMVLVLGMCSFADGAGKVDPVGTWKCEYAIADQKRTAELTIKKDGDKFVGTMNWPDQKDAKLKDVKLKDDSLTFSAVRKFQGQDIPIDYKLTIDGDKLKGKGSSDFGGQKQEFNIEGKRAKKDK